MTLTLNNAQDFYNWQHKAILETEARSYYRFIPVFDPDGELEASHWVPEKYPCKLTYNVTILYNELYEISFDFINE